MTNEQLLMLDSLYPPNNPVSLQKAKRQGHQALPLIISITKS